MPTKILFVCLGNICRSPSAEAIFLDLVNKNDVAEKFEVDSAATSAHHIGEKADSRMRKHAAKRGINITSISRQFDIESDFENFDYIIGMDDANIKNLKNFDKSGMYQNKILKMTDFNKKFNYNEVPDPYYGGEQGFELVLDILDEACKNLYFYLNKV